MTSAVTIMQCIVLTSATQGTDLINDSHIVWGKVQILVGTLFPIYDRYFRKIA